MGSTCSNSIYVSLWGYFYSYDGTVMKEIKLPKMNKYLVWGIILIVFTGLLAFKDVLIGNVPDPEPYKWTLIPQVTLIFTTLFIIGYLAGRENHKDKK